MIINKTFTFDMGHRLSNYVGKCSRIHGHTYKLEVLIEGEIDDRGLVIDFNDVSRIVKDLLNIKYDHYTLLYKDDVKNNIEMEGVIYVDYNPSAENIAREIFNDLKKELPIKEIILWETPTSYAKYN